MDEGRIAALETRVETLESRLDEASRSRLELSRWCCELEEILRLRGEVFTALCAAFGPEAIAAALAPDASTNGSSPTTVGAA